MDVIENEKYKTKFNLLRFKKDLESLCKEEISVCSENFVGPIKSQLQKEEKDDIFYISFNEKSNFLKLFKDDIKTVEYSYEEALDENITGHIFGFLNKDHISRTIEEGNTKRTENLKILKNLGSQINYVMLSPINKDSLLEVDTGIFINYNLGDVCLANPSNLNC